MQSLVLPESNQGNGNSLSQVLIAEPSQNAITGTISYFENVISALFNTIINIPDIYNAVSVIIDGSALNQTANENPSVTEFYINSNNQIVLSEDLEPVDQLVKVLVKPSQQVNLINTEILTDSSTGDNTYLVLTTLQAPTDIIVAEQIFVLADSATFLQPGQYYFNKSTKTIQLNTEGISNGSTILVTVQNYNYTIPNNRIFANIPNIVSNYVIDNFSLSCGVEGHPTLSDISFIVPQSTLNTVLNQFTIGQYINIFGYALMVSKQPSVTYSRRVNQCMITISFKGYHEELAGLRNELDQPIKLTDISPSIYLSQLVNRAGRFLIGKNPIILVDKNVDENSTTTPRSEITSKAITKSAFVDWSSAYIQLQDYYNTQIHYLTDAEVYGTDDKDGSILHYEYNGSGAVYQGVNLVKEYHNTILQPDNKNSDGQDGDEILTLITQDIDAHISPNIPKESLRLPSMAYDAGGITRTRVTVTTINGETVEEIEEIYGVLATSLDTYITSVDNTTEDGFRIAPRNLDFDTLWQLCSYKITTYNYNNEDHLIGTTVRGWYKRRFKQESDELELSRIYGRHLIDELTESERNLLAAPYLFEEAPITESSQNTLELLSKYYRDLPETEDEQGKFVKESLRTVNNFFEMPDPESTNEDPKPTLKTGAISNEKKALTIVSTKQPKIYLETNLNTNNSGEQLRDSAAFAQSSQIAGIPSTVNKLKLYGRSLTEPDPTNEESTVVYRVKSPGALDIKNTESISFPDVSDIVKAKQCAECQLSMENSKEALKLTIYLKRFLVNIKPGHRVYYNGVLWWVLNVSIDFSATYNNLCFDKFELQLGKWFDIPLTLTRN